VTIEETIVKTRNVVEEIRWESAIATEDGIPTTKKFTTETEREIARGGIETGRDPAAAPEAENAPVSDVADPDQDLQETDEIATAETFDLKTNQNWKVRTKKKRKLPMPV